MLGMKGQDFESCSKLGRLCEPEWELRMDVHSDGQNAHTYEDK